MHTGHFDPGKTEVMTACTNIILEYARPHNPKPTKMTLELGTEAWCFLPDDLLIP